jgi:nucleoside-diphosphate-sugar epimerase
MMRDETESRTEPLGARPGAGKIVAVTGAGGFIGGRVVALLRQQTGVAHVRAYARRPNGSGCETLRLDDAKAVERALSGCHALVHCAFDFHDMTANVRIIRVLGPICAALGVRLVLLSSAAVYEPFPDGLFDEMAPSEPVGIPYSDTKISIEQEVIHQSRTGGLDVVILQPTLVYGPHCRQWTDTPARELLTGRVVLPDGGRGICNAVYVDDVAAAALAAIGANVASGERFIVSGADTVTWSGFFLALKAALGTGTVSVMPPSPAAPGRLRPARAPAVSPARTLMLRVAARVIGPRTRSKLKFALRKMRAGGKEIVHVPEGAKFDLYRSIGIASTAKARRLLGWEPRITFDQGMEQTGDYLRSAFAREIARVRQRVRHPAGIAPVPPETKTAPAEIVS